MKKLPNGETIFNACPYPVTFWDPSWEYVVVVGPDEVISGVPVEQHVTPYEQSEKEGILFVNPVFYATKEGEDIIAAAREGGATIIIGSIVAAQAYPGDVLGMCPAEGFERVPPSEKRIRPDKFISTAPPKGRAS